MSDRPDNTQYVRRVQLPSGRSIEVVYFESVAEAAAAEPVRGPGGAGTRVELHVCPECERELVYPVEWEETSPTHWEVLLRCPNCEWSEVGDFDQPTVDRFDEQLDLGTEILLRDLQHLERANMEDEIERFTKALGADAILPEDFG
jgi:hypothetical protein